MHAVLYVLWAMHGHGINPLTPNPCYSVYSTLSKCQMILLVKEKKGLFFYILLSTKNCRCHHSYNILLGKVHCVQFVHVYTVY